MHEPSLKDRQRLRKLAAEYAEIVNSEKMKASREVWRLTNRLLERTIPFQIEDNGSFFSDLMPKLECEGEFERGIESGLLQSVTNHMLIDDDRVLTPYWRVPWCVKRPDICRS